MFYNTDDQMRKKHVFLLLAVTKNTFFKFCIYTFRDGESDCGTAVGHDRQL